MKAVGIRELKAKLSRYLEEVRRGEVVLVTDRGTIVAELRAPGTHAETPGDPFERKLLPWVQDGRASPGEPNQASWYEVSPLRCEVGTAQRVLDELRGER